MSMLTIAIPQFVENLRKNIQGVETTEELLIRTLIAVGSVVVLLLLRNIISGGILTVIGKTFCRRKPRVQSLIKDGLKKPLAFFLVLAGIALGLQIIAPSGELHKIGLFLIKAGGIVCACWGGVRLLNGELDNYTFDTAAGEDKTRLTAFRFISNVAKIVIICIGALLVLELLGYSATRIFAALGIGGVAVAFACKDAVENLISGFIIVFNKPFRVGDFIAVGELSGTVEDIAVRSTTLRALDGDRYVLPNTALTNQSIINYADMEKRLINQTFTLHYKHSRTDLERFEQDLRALLQADPAVVQDDIRTDFVNYGAHGMDVQVYYYVIAPTVVELGQIKNRLNLQIKELLDKEGFELAYNSATVYLEQETEGKDQ